jgi:hypothetical protein
MFSSLVSFIKNIKEFIAWLFRRRRGVSRALVSRKPQAHGGDAPWIRFQFSAWPRRALDDLR